MSIPIFISTDKNYIIPAITLIASVVENTQENVNFYILHGNLDAENQKFISNALTKYQNLQIEFLKIDESIFQKYPINRHFTHACYYRFLIPELKKDIGKAIYLDVDMVADFDINELYSIDMDGKPLAAIQEKCMAYMKQFIIHCFYLGLNHKTYFNSGMLIMDLNYFRENNITELLFNSLNANQDKIICPDQDILNIIFANNYKKLDYQYNVLTSLQRLLKDNNDDDIKAFENIKIYHFAGEQKPWNTTVAYEEKWFEYANKVIDKKDLDTFCSSKYSTEPRKLFGFIKESSNNTICKSLLLFGKKIRLYKRHTDQYITKKLFGIQYSKKINPDYIKLYMTIVCKDEEKIIEQQIRFHKAMGVDGFIVLNHNSTDNTLLILEKLKSEGIISEIIQKSEPVHKHHIWVEEMIKMAKQKYGATWVINADADEFYFSKSLNLKESIKKSGDVNALLINSRFLFPDNREDFLSSPYFMTKPFLDYELNFLDLDTTTVWLNESAIQCTKVIHKTDGFISIKDGNHNVEMKNQKMITPSDIVYYHYHIKNYQEYEAKTKRWTDSLKHTPKGMNNHLKRNLELYKQGKLKEDYENKYGETRRNFLIEQGAISIDLSVYNFLKWKGFI